MPFVIPLGCQAFGNVALQIKSLLVGRSILNRYLSIVAIDDDADVATGDSGHLESVEPGIFEVGSKVSTEIGNAGNARERGERHSHRFCSARELRDSPKRSVRNDQRILRISRQRSRSNRFMQQVESQTAPAEEVISHLRVQFRGSHRTGCQIDAEDPVGVTALNSPPVVFHTVPSGFPSGPAS